MAERCKPRLDQGRGIEDIVLPVFETESQQIYLFPDNWLRTSHLTVWGIPENTWKIHKAQGAEHYRHHHGYSPFSGGKPRLPEKQIINVLKTALSKAVWRLFPVFPYTFL